MKKMAAGIVLYNPEDAERLYNCLNSLLIQVDKVYIYDNSEKKYDFSLPENVHYFTKNKNMGIAYALNRIMSLAKSDGFEWVITMDQDSILPEGIIDDFKKKAIPDSRIAILCPQVMDRRRSYMKIEDNTNQEYVEECITSASCTSIQAWEKVGGFDEKLFIDLVDNEFCKRLVINGFKIVRLNAWVLDQEFGDIIPKSERKQLFWIRLSKICRNENIAKFSYKKNVNPLRVYYTCRNIIYVNRKLKKFGKTAYTNYNCNGYFGFIISFMVPSLLRASEKRKVFTSIIKGTISGLRMNVEHFESINRD